MSPRWRTPRRVILSTAWSMALLSFLVLEAHAQMSGTQQRTRTSIGRVRSLMEELETRGLLTLQDGRAAGGPRQNPFARPTPWSGTRSAGPRPTAPGTFRLEQAVRAAPTPTPYAYGFATATNRIYPPRLQVAFTAAPADPEFRAAWLAEQLRETLHLGPEQKIVVKLEGEKAILQGEVASDREKNLARLLVLFEPGVNDVDDTHLRVRPADPQELPDGSAVPALRSPN